MFKKLAIKLGAMLCMLTASIGVAFAQVDVNKADQAALETVKGIGPSTSAKILEARKRGGAFKSWPDFAERVHGVGDKTAIKLSDGGLTVNGQSLANAGVVPAFAGKSNQPGTKTNDMGNAGNKGGVITAQPPSPKNAGSSVATAKPLTKTADRPQMLAPAR